MNTVRTLMELENIKKNQIQVKNIIPEIKNTLEEINSRLNDTEKWISGQIE